MIMAELLNRVRYPDEPSSGYDDRIPYDEAAEGLELQLSSATGQLKRDVQDTLNELKQRWADRQKSLTVA